MSPKRAKDTRRRLDAACLVCAGRGVGERDEFKVCCFTEVLSLAASVEFPVCCGLKKLLIMSFGGFSINVISSLLWNLRDISSLIPVD